MSTDQETPVTVVGARVGASDAESHSGVPAKPKRPTVPAIQRSDAATCKCGARWTGTSKCHCSAPGCHRLFSGPATFDRHRVNGQCVDPATITTQPRDKSTPPRLFFTIREGVWCAADEFTGAGQLFGGKS